jgi:hypothetical protein
LITALHSAFSAWDLFFVQRSSWPFLVYVVIKLGCENDGQALYRMVDPAFLKGGLNRPDESFSSNVNDA